MEIIFATIIIFNHYVKLLKTGELPKELSKDEEIEMCKKLRKELLSLI